MNSKDLTFRDFSFYDDIVLWNITLRYNETFYFYYDFHSTDDGDSYSYVIEKENIDKLMAALHVNNTNEIVNAILKLAKTREIKFDVNRFIQLLDSNNIPYTKKHLGWWETEWKDGEPNLIYHSLLQK